jgi:hypothetical protein
MSTTDGGPIANNINGYWDITIDYELDQDADFDGVVSQWTVNGTPVNPLYNFSGICCATPTNPILPGEAYYNSGFNDYLTAGEQTDWNEIYVTPYSYVEAGGIDPNTANGFTWALHFDETNPVPEPSAGWLTITGLCALGLFQARKGLAWGLASRR